ncbi:MAG TPA: lactate utilization protein [Chloroflexota bacterium]|nr:lactate utilization protein [Chloroflexota bacterium]
MHPATKWFYATQAKAAVEALQRNNFGAVYAEDSAAACQAILSMIPAEASIGFGGSMSLGDVGLLDQLRSGNYKLINPPWLEATLAPADRMALRRTTPVSDVFLCGTNALTLDGKLVNTDANGNRLVGMLFGPKKSIVVAGANKIAPNVEEALERIRRIAAPINAKRLNCDTPCTTTSLCGDCRSKDRICCATLILDKKPKAIDLTVVVVAEELGF